MDYKTLEIGSFSFENGNWIWDNERNAVKFIRNSSVEENVVKWNEARKSNWKHIFKKREFAIKYQRKIQKEDLNIIILQDIKDVVMFESPMPMLDHEIIYLIHTASYDRFIRALIVYILYFLQLSPIMEKRVEERENKLRSYESEKIELDWAHNLSELRVVVAKEYFNLTHVNEKRVREDSSNLLNDAQFLNKFLKLTTQIVWICFHRTCLDDIDKEIGRLIRSEIVNSKFHPNINPMDMYTKFVLHGNYFDATSKSNIYNEGKNIKKRKPLYNTKSPLCEAFLHCNKDEKIWSIYHKGFKKVDLRMVYLENLFCAPEEKFSELGIDLGILGKDRHHFDELLNDIVEKKRRNSSVINMPLMQHFYFTAQLMNEFSKSSDMLGYKKLLNIPKHSDLIYESEKLPPRYKQRLPDIEKRDIWIRRYNDYVKIEKALKKSQPLAIKREVKALRF